MLKDTVTALKLKVMSREATILNRAVNLHFTWELFGVERERNNWRCLYKSRPFDAMGVLEMLEMVEKLDEFSRYYEEYLTEIEKRIEQVLNG